MSTPIVSDLLIEFLKTSGLWPAAARLNWRSVGLFEPFENLKEEARAHSEKNWGMMLAALKISGAIDISCSRKH